jgi:rhodanese-related sulfurtransferase
MGDLLASMPGARRALFAKYHIGGCSSCGFSPNETLAEVCRRNEGLDPAEVIAQLEASAEQDAAMQISPEELSAMRGDGRPLRLIDVRSREEHEAVRLPDSELMTQELLRSLFGEDKDQRIVVYCHHGIRSLDSAAYLAGHGLTNVRSLSGGIDAWSCEIDPGLPRYRLEME